MIEKTDEDRKTIERFFRADLVEVFHPVLAGSVSTVPHLLSLLNREETLAKVVPAITKSTAGNPMPPKPPLMKPNNGGIKTHTRPTTLPHRRGKLGLKPLELATACDAF